MWWTDAITNGWSIARDLMGDLGPILFLPVAFTVVAFVWALVTNRG